MEGRTVIVTGGAGGIGFATAEILVKQGAHVVLADTDPQTLESRVASLRAGGGAADGEAVDVTDWTGFEELVTDLDAHTQIYGLVNAAGVAQFGTVSDVSETDWDRVVDINLKGTYIACRAALKCMVKRREGAIVNLASISGRTKSIYSAPNYVASKAGVVGLTMTLAAQHAADNIRVNCVAPGVIDTPMTASYSKDQRSRIQASIPMQRNGEAREVAEVITDLLSPRWSYVTGQTIDINGGLFMH
jgi:NAD(P)-dependent dehydrogenase (short-subunit alcohol dehydrogenase family)